MANPDESPLASDLPSPAPALESSPGDKPSAAWRVVFTLACATSFLLYLHRYTWGIISSDVAKEFGWSTKTLGWLDSAFLAAYAPGQIPSGMLCDWFGARALLTGMIVCWSLALGGTTLAWGLWSMGAARFGFGLAQAGCYPTLGKVSKNWFPLSIRSVAQGWIASFSGRMGGAVANVLVGTLLMGYLHLTWQTSLQLFALVGVGFGVAFYILFRNTPSEHPRANAAEAARVVESDPHADQGAKTRLSWSALFRNRSVWFLFFRAVASNLADVLFLFWVPRYLLDIKLVDIKAAGWMSSVPLIGGAIGGAFSGWLQTVLMRRLGRRWGRSLVPMAGKMTASALMLYSLQLDAAVAIVWTFFVVKFFSDWEQPAEWGTLSDIGGRNSATVFASVNTVGAAAGILAGPLNGWILTYFSDSDTPTLAGWNALFTIMAIEYMLAASAWLMIDCTRTVEESAK